MSDWFFTYGYGEVHDGLLIGAYPLDSRDVEALRRLGVQRVLNLVEDTEYEPGERELVTRAYARRGMRETRMNLVDFGQLPAERLEAAVTLVAAWLAEDLRVYVHCRAGWQRSAAVAAGAVALVDGIGIEQALASVKRHKPTADPLPHQRDDLVNWWMTRETR